MKVKFIVTVDDDEMDVEYAKDIMDSVGKTEIVDLGKSVLVIGGGEMLALSCSLAGMCAEINDAPAQLEECVEVFREVYSNGIVTELQLKMMEDCENKLNELFCKQRKRW